MNMQHSLVYTRLATEVVGERPATADRPVEDLRDEHHVERGRMEVPSETYDNPRYHAPDHLSPMIPEP